MTLPSFHYPCVILFDSKGNISEKSIDPLPIFKPSSALLCASDTCKCDTRFLVSLINLSNEYFEKLHQRYECETSKQNLV